MKLFIAIHGKPELIPIVTISFAAASGGRWVEYETIDGKLHTFYGAYISMSTDSEETQRVYTFYSLPDPELAAYADYMRARHKENAQ